MQHGSTSVSRSILLVRTDPCVPNPAAARSMLETALEPLSEFDIDTTEVREQAEEIQRQKQQVAQQLQQIQEQQDEPVRGMFR
ncbi:PAC2 family protein [Haloarchaeobius amylolyticus]|uniref:PAC2 family protein n=1 Tax=Haloarchaeobius amylolyticus TaxID=1198296 RepID=A0ABD6BM46_9EURY